MKRLYVAGQNEETREWVPVAELRTVEDGYEFRYTSGAQRLPGFVGLSRMQSLDKVYHSKALFPFFANRLLSKSRPEYKSYLRWLGLEGISGDAMDVLSVTGTVRATDSYELIAIPETRGDALVFDFFPRGLRYQPGSSLALLMEQEEGDRVCLMKDLQNEKDSHALALRTHRPVAIFIGYVPRYYCLGITRLLDDKGASVDLRIKRINRDAPLDMKLLVTLKATVPSGFELLEGVEDFKPLTSERAEWLSGDALLKTNLNF